MGQKIYDLWYIVASVKADIDQVDTKHDVKFMKWAIDGFRDMNEAGVLPCYKSVRLPINADGTVDWPDDYEDYSKIGLCVNGRIINFTLNQSLCLAPPNTDCCGQTLPDLSAVVYSPDFVPPMASGYWNWQWYYLPSFHNGQFVAGMFGVGEGFSIGQFAVDAANRRFKLNFEAVAKFATQHEIVLEYKSNGGIDEGNAYIPEFAIKALRSYVHWQRCLFSKNPADNQFMETHRRRYQRNIKRIVAQVNGMTTTQILDIIRASIYQMPKR